MSTIFLTKVGFVVAVLLLFYSLGTWLFSICRRFQITTPLKGPERLHAIWGWTRAIIAADDVDQIYEGWVEKFGSAVAVPTMFWNQNIILTDPKAITHLFANDPEIYGQHDLIAGVIETMLGRNNIVTASKDEHKRLRKALAPAFSSAAIRRVTEVFYDSSHKTKARWEAIIDANGDEAVVDIHDWMNRISFDSIGIAGFGHDFNSLDGQPFAIADLFGANLNFIFFDALDVIPSIPIPNFITKFPLSLNKFMAGFRNTMCTCAHGLLSRTKKDAEALGEHSVVEKTAICLLIQAESSSSSSRMTNEEVTSIMNFLLLAGKETTGSSLTWALVELARNPTIQKQLREELQQFQGDPTYEQLMSASTFPILDGVVHEVLRLHPPISQSNKVANKDDILPLSRPYTTSSGTVVDRISIAKGSSVTVPISMISRSRDFWGDDAKEFNPSRWLPTSSPPTKISEFMGHRHLLTFSDGPRMCLGKNFALAEFKAALTVLIKHFTFEFENGIEGTDIEIFRGIVKSPKIAGRDGVEMPMRIRRV
ncbi:cytochrome P450 [Flagelloscypha sp. PMI_526]|nr:cytochrome P450 [Flagelloscypha sp. PMI_526]